MRRLFLSTLLFWGLGYAAYAEKITNYKINVTIEQSGELAIVESIEYDFEGQSKHGMFRDIPFTIKINSRIIDLGLYDFSVQMDDGRVEWVESTMGSTHAGDIKRLKIGSASTLVTGKHLYKIAYRVKKGVLPAAQNEQNDAIRWNIVGTGWNIPIENVTSVFYLPQSLSAQNIALSSYTGGYGAKGSNARTRWINDRELEVHIENLKLHEGATVEIAYPSGLLDQSGADNVKATFMDWFLGNWHWGALAGFLLYFKTMLKRYTGFVDKRSIAVWYEAPKGLSLLQSGVVLDKFADDEDYAAAILELGYLGYLTIDQKDKNADPVLVRTDKKAENLTMDQRYLLDSTLFKGTKSFVMSGGSESKAKKLQNSFKHINKMLYTWSVSDDYMSENPQRIRKSFVGKSIMWLLPFFALAGYTLFKKFGVDVVFMLLFPLIFGGVGLGMVFGNAQRSSKIFGLIFATAGMTPLFMMNQEGVTLNSLFLGPVGVLIVLIVAMAVIYKKIGKYTQKGAYASTQLLGLKEFISRVKEDEIKRRLAMDPLYLEKMLPYAVLFKETKHWLSFYDILNVRTPYWYNGNIHNVGRFSSSLNSVSTSPNTSSNGGGGFSGGGGFTGGGGGGGGGGSW